MRYLLLRVMAPSRWATTPSDGSKIGPDLPQKGAKMIETALRVFDAMQIRSDGSPGLNFEFRRGSRQ